MQVGMVGLGRVGAGVARRLLGGGHEVVVHDLSRDAMAAVEAEGAHAVLSLADLAATLTPPRAVWLTIPAALVRVTVGQLCAVLAEGDTVADAGNGRHQDTVERYTDLAERGIGLVDAGTSAATCGSRGYTITVGGDEPHVARLAPLLDTLAPDGGWAHVGPAGSGHYTKMVLGGVEYALAQVYAEGFDLVAGGPFPLDAAQIAAVWQRTRGVGSSLLDHAAVVLTDDPKLERQAAAVEDAGEGRYAVEAAVEQAVPTPALASSVFARFASRTDDRFGTRMLAALRDQLGGPGEARHEEDLG